VHVVQPGETLYSIAIRYGTTVQAIINANGITNPDQIYQGQKLNVPTQGAPLAGARAAASATSSRQGSGYGRFARTMGVAL